MSAEEGAARRRFLAAVATLTGLSIAQIRSILNSGALSQVHNLFPWGTFAADLGALSGTLQSAFSQAAAPLSPRMQLRMDLIDEKAVRWAGERSSRFIVEISEEMRATIRSMVAESVAGGMDTDELARKLSRTVGLHERYARAVDNSWTKTFEQQVSEGRTATQARQIADRNADRYRQRLLNVRAQTIARTEIHAAQNAGRYAGWEDAMEQGFASPQARKQWITYDPCEICQPMDGEIVPWNEPFSNGDMMPAAHPNCVCQAILLEAA
jgi:hypothetical protein